MPADAAEAEGAVGSNAAPAPSKPAPTKVAYHPNVRCLRGGGGVGPVIVGPMYRVGEGCVSEEMATEEEKAKGPVAPAKQRGEPVEGFDLRGWAAADIQGLRGADGELDLQGAILCGVNLMYAELQGANLFRAQLQGASLGRAQLQGANLYRAQLQGASLRSAQLQGANLYRAQLQGADLSHADLSILPKDSPLPKKGAAGEMEATKEDRPTTLLRANLSELPKGNEYQTGTKEGVKVSDAARPTNLTDAKASGADFTGADLRGATFTATTLKDAKLQDATFTPFRPPERPASGAMHAAWRAKALLGSVARAAIAAADDDDDDSDDGIEDGGEEESPVDAEIETAIDAVMDKLAAAAQTLMHTVDDSVGKVQALLRSSLLKSRKAARRTSSTSALDAEPNRIFLRSCFAQSWRRPLARRRPSFRPSPRTSSLHSLSSTCQGCSKMRARSC